jgi:hypothetical protein
MTNYILTVNVNKAYLPIFIPINNIVFGCVFPSFLIFFLVDQDSHSECGS